MCNILDPKEINRRKYLAKGRRSSAKNSSEFFKNRSHLLEPKNAKEKNSHQIPLSKDKCENFLAIHRSKPKRSLFEKILEVENENQDSMEELKEFPIDKTISYFGKSNLKGSYKTEIPCLNDSLNSQENFQPSETNEKIPNMQNGKYINDSDDVAYEIPNDNSLKAVGYLFSHNPLAHALWSVNNNPALDLNIKREENLPFNRILNDPFKFTFENYDEKQHSLDYSNIDKTRFDFDSNCDDVSTTNTKIPIKVFYFLNEVLTIADEQSESITKLMSEAIRKY